MDTTRIIALALDIIYVVICLLFIMFILRLRLKHKQHLDKYMIAAITLLAAQAFFIVYYYVDASPIDQPDFILIFNLNSLEFY